MTEHTAEQLETAAPPELTFEAFTPELLLRVLDAVKDRVYLKDAQGQLAYVNQAFLDTYDLTADEVLGKRHEELLPEEMIATCQAADESVLDQRQTICMETHWQDAKSGAHHWCEAYKSPIRDSAGNVMGVVGISRDITSKRLAKEELGRQTALLEQIVETVPDWIFVKDRKRRIVLANHTFYEQLGLTPEAVLGRDPAKYLPAELERIAHETDTIVLEQGQPQCVEVALINPAGKEIQLEIRKLPILENDDVVGIVSVGRDVTAARQAQQQSKRNESLLLHASRLSSLGELAAGIAHEVNQPLFSILNYAIAIENRLRDADTLDVESVRHWIQQIHSEAKRGGQITQRLKSFARPTDAQRAPADINTIVLEAIAVLKMEARDAGIVIETELAEDLPPLTVDRIQIVQVLVNLLKNAIEACGERSDSNPRIHISSRRVASGVQVTVADDGPGITAAEGMNIFDPFQTTKHEGIGLGLAISKSIIEAHHGQLTCEPNTPDGATFNFLLPTET